MSTFVIAEAGVNHNGSEKLALELVDVAVTAGADAIKFQTFSTEKVVQMDAPKAEYQTNAIGEGSQYEMVKRLELSYEAFDRIIAYCRSQGIEFMSTAFDFESAQFLVSRSIKRIKIASGEITNFHFIRDLAKYNLPIILSTGMATMAEVKAAIKVICDVREQFSHKEPLSKILTILHCTSNYPAALENVNLLAMHTIARETELPVGYSDHTLGITASVAAVAMGATVIEKHITLDKKMAGPDHEASLSPCEFSELVSQIRSVEIALGSSKKQPTQSELEVRDVARRSVTASLTLEIGDVLTPNSVALLRPANGICASLYDSVLGRKVVRRVEAGKSLTWDDLEYSEKE